MGKKISIIIATYNASLTIRRCIDSIVRQKTSEIELLIVDGESKDCTLDIVKDFGESIDVLISERDKGIYDAWNKGIKHSSGQWIMFIGADDILENDALKSYVSFLKDVNPLSCDIITAKATVIDCHGNLIQEITRPYKWEEFQREFLISHGSSLHNRCLFDEIGTFDISVKICADYELLLRKKLRALFFDKYILRMQYGGVSTTYLAIKDAFLVRKKRQSVSMFENILLFVKGCCSLVIRRFIVQV